MRLTVRTLLAYLDHVLPAEAAQTLEAKLKESAYATMLADRIKASVKRSDLAAPKVDAVHPIEDANTIAEYLDSVLQAEHIPEVERVLLDSDVHMSEAAACHQILSLVLSKPAQVPHDLRDKINTLLARLPNEAAGSTSAAGASLAAGSIASIELPTAKSKQPAEPVASVSDIEVEPVAVPFRGAAAAASDNGHATTGIAGASPRKPDVPEYLRASRPSRVVPWLMTLALCAALLFIMSKAFQPANRLASDSVDSDGNDRLVLDTEPAAPEQPIAGVKQPDAASPSPSEPSPDASAQAVPSGDKPLAEASPTAAAPAASSMPPDTAKTDTSDPKTPAVSQPATSEASDAAASTEVKTQPTETSPAIPVPDQTMPDKMPETATSDAAGDVDSPVSATSPSAIVAAAESTVPMKDSEPGTDAADTPGSDLTPIPVEPLVPQPAKEPAIPVGKLETTSTILIHRNAEKQMSRVSNASPISTGGLYHNLPTFRTAILLEGGAKLTAVGASEFAFSKAVDEAAVVKLDYGRFLLQSKTPDTHVRLQVAGREAQVSLPTADSIAAIHVTAFRAPGTDPEAADASQSLIAVQAMAGAIGWSIDDADEVQLASPVRWSQLGKSAAVSDLPDPAVWMREPAANEVSVESIARKGLLELIDPKKPIELELRGAVAFRRAEVAGLAARCLLGLGISDDYFGPKCMFNDEQQKSHWSEHLATIRSQLDRGAAKAQGIRETLVRANATEAKNMYRLMWGYSQDQLAKGSDFALVEALNDPALSVRVLAFENLRQVTGETFSYRPQDSSIRRSAAAKKWDSRRDAGSIRRAEPVTPLSILSAN